MKKIQSALASQYAERDEVIEGLLVALIARQHVLLIGPPGTGKSALVSDLTSRITGANYFQWLLTRFSTPEELFGPVSLKELEQGVYKRNTTGKLPEANIAFLDEVFKSNSAILNALLTLINERLFYNNGHPVQSPLMTLVGASNEYPEEGEGLEALFDRFLLRFEVDYVAQESSFISMMKGAAPVQASISLETLVEMQFYSDMVTVSDEVYETLSKIRTELRDEGIRPSDRRFKQAVSILRAKAALDCRDHVIREDILILKNSLWERPEQREKVAGIVKKHAQDPVKTKLEEVREEMKSILDSVKQNNTPEQAVEATKKLKMLGSELQTLIESYPGHKEIDKAIRAVQNTLEKIASQVLGV
jgi:MoxR-like ATPase